MGHTWFTMAPSAPVYLEAWRADGGYVRVPGPDDVDGFFGDKGSWDERDEQRARLAASAPACVRALLAVEWATAGLEGHSQCPECSGFQPRLTQPDRAYFFHRMDHHPACPLNAALTLAALPTQTERSEARRQIALARTSAGHDLASQPK